MEAPRVFCFWRGTTQQNTTFPEMGGKSTYCSLFRHTSFLRTHKDVHTSGGNGDFGAWELKGDIFQMGVHSVCNRFNASLFFSLPPSLCCSFCSVCLPWQMCGGLFGGVWDASMPRVHNVSLISVETLMSERSPYTKKHFLQYFLFLPSNFFLTLPSCYFWIFGSLRLSPADLHPFVSNACLRS